MVMDEAILSKISQVFATVLRITARNTSYNMANNSNYNCLRPQNYTCIINVFRLEADDVDELPAAGIAVGFPT